MSWDQRRLRHTEPCRQCPWRRKAIQGYMGGHSLESYRQPTSIGMPTSCHCKDYGAQDPCTSLCAGSLACIANDPVVVPMEDYAEAVTLVGGRPDVFGSVEEFAEYHRSGPLGEPIDGGYARSRT